MQDLAESLNADNIESIVKLFLDNTMTRILAVVFSWPPKQNSSFFDDSIEKKQAGKKYEFSSIFLFWFEKFGRLSPSTIKSLSSKICS